MISKYLTVRPILKLVVKALSIGFIISLHSCTDDSTDICYSFDERQCASDPWRIDNTGRVDDTLDDLITSYFLSKDIVLESITIDGSFHEVTCLACDVCPSNTPVYITVQETEKEKVDALDLLSLTEIGCGGL